MISPSQYSSRLSAFSGSAAIRSNSSTLNRVCVTITGTPELAKPSYYVLLESFYSILIRNGWQRNYQQNAARTVIMGRRRVRLVVEGLPDVVPSTCRAGTQRVSHTDNPAVYAAPAPSGYSGIEHDAVAAATSRP